MKSIVTLAITSGCNDVVLESSTLGGIGSTGDPTGESTGTTVSPETTPSEATVDPDSDDSDDDDPTRADTSSSSSGPADGSTSDTTSSSGASAGESSTTTDGSTTTDPSTTTDGSSTTDPSTTTDGSSTTDPSTTDGSTTTDPSTTDGSTTADPSTSTDASTTDGGSTSDASTSDGGTSSGEATSSDGGGSSSSDDGGSSSDGSSSDDGSTGGVDPTDGLPYATSFDLVDGSPWPAAWTASQGVVLADIDGGAGRLQGETGVTARMLNASVSALDYDAVFTVRFESFLDQGAGFYVRQNGGVLNETNPPGQGYAVFVEGGFMGLIGIWRELDGVEEVIQAVPAPVTIVDGESYRIRIQCTQQAGFTELRTRMWNVGDVEPSDWTIETTDASVELQDVQGGIGADVYEYDGTPAIWFDDITVVGS
ncbi:MAG: hypothetical protein IAG13_08240 [Deltaproteobacteria bacterium]|nr:hypothetical protein [Nannocystaceae bacterium]